MSRKKFRREPTEDEWAFRIAKLLEVSLHDVLQGTALPKPTCPHCGKVIV